MSLLVTGSIGIDSVKTPFGVSEDSLGGSAIYFSMAASFFSPVRFVGVIGEDCPFDLEKVFETRDVDLTGLEVRKGSKTFRWKATYADNPDDRTTDLLELNVLAEAPPRVPEEYRDSKYVFLANTAPSLQIELLKQVENPVFVAADTMNCWIENDLEDLKSLLKRVDCLVLNEDEARQLAKEENLIVAAESITSMGPGVVVAKKGESGSLVYSKSGRMFILPAYPAREVKDATGAGDSFAGAMMGYIARQGKTDFETLSKAVGYGTAVASFAISDFSLRGLESLTYETIEKRLGELRQLVSF